MDKLREAINSILEEEIGGLHHTDYEYNDKLYSLTADVAAEYGEWRKNHTGTSYDKNKNPLYYVMYKEEYYKSLDELFSYFIANIYHQPQIFS